MEAEKFLVEELEDRLIIEAVEYKHRLDENWQTEQFDEKYFPNFITGELYTEFVTAIYDRTRPLNRTEINRFLSLSVAQFKTHTPEKREAAFVQNYHDTYWYPNIMPGGVNDYEKKSALYVHSQYKIYFHLFKEATEKALDDFKNGLIGDTDKTPTTKSEKKVQDFFDEVKQGNITQLEIYNQVQKFTENFDVAKLEILFIDFGFYLFVEKEERLGECTEEEIAKAIQQLEEKGKEIPYKKIPELPTLNTKFKKGKTNKLLDVEKLLYPFEFFTCYQFEKFLIEEVKKRKEKNTAPLPATDKKEIAKPNKPQQTFDSLLSSKNAKFILQMLEDMSITTNGKSNLSERRKGALRGVVEASIDKSILPQLSIDSLCKLIADKIGLELNAKLDFSTTSEKNRKKAVQYITDHYKK